MTRINTTEIWERHGYKIELIQENSRAYMADRQNAATDEKFDPLRNA